MHADEISANGFITKITVNLRPTSAATMSHGFDGGKWYHAAMSPYRELPVETIRASVLQLLYGVRC